MTVDPRVERFARALTVMDGVHPDSLVTRYQPYRTETGKFYVIASDEWAAPQPAWRMYIKDAEMVLAELGAGEQ